MPPFNSHHFYRSMISGILLAVTITFAAVLRRPETKAGQPQSLPPGAPRLIQTEAAQEKNILVPLARTVLPSVVNISTLSAIRGALPQEVPDDLFRQFSEELLGRRKNSREIPRAVSLGSGFVIEVGDTENGGSGSSTIILTNHHVIGQAEEIKIKFTESAEEIPSPGEIVGRDPELDIALLRVDSNKEILPLALGDSNTLEVGEYVIAVGNPFAQGHSVTHGIISAKGRPAPQFPLGSYLQTDAPINPGNSGGPLVNLQGEVIGINNAIEARAQGIGFAIPISLVKAVLPELRARGIVERGYIGILTEHLTPEIAAKLGVPKETRAPFISHVYAGDPADRAGLKPYDVVLEVAGNQIQTPSDLVALVTATPIGKNLSFKIVRGGKTRELLVPVGKRPSPEGDSSSAPRERGR
jgi:serine protease Do